ncbi:DEAD/DEAH box helicase [Micromonospora sp. NPDC050397]|uniref:DEAD/DEAH box helicase n=1 Tax=Micromonospora sp. NPDC050397 TaxID=3364279 RepID=UPI00384C7C31
MTDSLQAAPEVVGPTGPGRPPVALPRCAVLFEPADPPRRATVVFWSVEGEPEPVGEPGQVELLVPDRAGLSPRTVPVRRVPVRDALPLLLRARRGGDDSHPTAVFWGAVADEALHMVGRGRLVPGIAPSGYDAWRVGPLDPPDLDRIAALGAAMPPAARAVPVPAAEPARLPDATTLVRRFLDAVADALPRTPDGTGPYAADPPRAVPELVDWAGEVAAVDTGIRLSLRVEADPDDVGGNPLRAVLQVFEQTDAGSLVDARTLWEPAGAGPRIDRPESARTDTTLALRRAGRVFPALLRLLEEAVPDTLVLDDDEVTELLGGGADRLAAAGVAVHWPRELVADLHSSAVLGDARRQPPAGTGGLFGDGRMLEFNWQVALGGAVLTRAELDALAEAHRPVARLRGRWVLVDPEIARRARQRSLPPMNPVAALAAALTGTVDVDGRQVAVGSTGWLDELRRRVADPDGGSEVLAAPDGLAATLRDYQLRGLRWLVRMTSLGLGACLADDMGLGKTVTLIALHLHRQREAATAGATLVVCPASLLGNWEREVRRFAPGVAVRRFHGSARELDDADGFVLTTYGTMRLDAARLAEQDWGLVVADEAQHVKNPASETARALRTIDARSRVALTGTPVENNLTELWAILDWTTPGLLGPLPDFRERWVRSDGRAADLDRLARLVGPFLLRRRKSDPGVAPELPAKTETDQPVTLTPEQAGLYQAVVRETLDRIRDSTGMARRGLVLALLTALKQICNHPAQYLDEERPRLRGRSGKLELLDELLDTILAEGGAVLVFTQYVAMARLLEEHLAERGITTALLHGGTAVNRREELVARFQAGEIPVFLLSLKAAGTGLNLTRADHVVHYDRWWNPAVEEQATDRAYRIGQTRPVQVHRLIAEGTVEDLIARTIAEKRGLAEAVLAGGAAALTELTDDELADLVSLRDRGAA